ncbi:MAG: PIN domain-containing protein [Bryobacterales bacterium]|nr:PIN domain-containing protein [Bryobacterales bacterium]MDE0622347.1 PIN domain-containing protein [Bryobacterales bacterium]
MILLDTYVLIDALTGSQRLGPALRSALARGNRMAIPSLVLFEWRRGPRNPAELALQEALFPSDEAVSFGPAEAIGAAELYRSVGRSRSREVDLAIAACAITLGAELWTQNIADLIDIPGLNIHEPV